MIYIDEVYVLAQFLVSLRLTKEGPTKTRLLQGTLTKALLLKEGLTKARLLHEILTEDVRLLHELTKAIGC